jgi:predicted 3-demethylubiquinone-9 3-methyltransferase (glyoxalase superfamily)
MQQIAPFLWLDSDAGQAARFYASIFKNSKVESASPTFAVFYLNGVKFMALNGGPEFTFSPALSFFVNCQTQAEVDDLWEKLSQGGEKGRCGWLKDKFGVSWQVIPQVLGDMLNDDDDTKSGRVREAMLKMGKIDIATLKRAYESV